MKRAWIIVIVLGSIGVFLNSQLVSTPKVQTALVYVFLSAPPPFQWVAAVQSARFAPVYLICPRDTVAPAFASEIRLIAKEDLENAALADLRRYYKPRDMMEPWGRENLERILYLAEWMRRYKMTKAAYMDSDSFLLQPLPRLPSSCDSMVAIQREPLDFENLDWTVWVGASILRLKVLDQFERFLVEIYRPQFVPLLEQKQQYRPYVGDMTMWYLFVAATSEYGRVWKTKGLPRMNSTFTFCNALDAGFDYKHGYKGNWREKRSIHFQGIEKNELVEWVKMNLMM